MIVLRHLVAAFILLLWPVAAGLCIGTMSKRKNRILPGLSGLYAEGTVFMLALFELCFFVVSSMGSGLDRLVLLWGILSVIMLSAGVLCCFLMKKKHIGIFDSMNGTSDSSSTGKNIGEKSFSDKEPGVAASVTGGRKSDKRSLITIAAVFIIIAVIMMLHAAPVTDYGYRSVESTVLVLSTRSFFGIDPLTGLMSNDILLNDRVWGLPAFYACICRMTGIEMPWYLLRFIIPCWVLIISFCILSSAQKIFFNGNVLSVYLIFMLAACFSGGNSINPFYDLMNVAWEGRTYIAFLILPAAVLSISSLLTSKERRKPGAVVALCFELLICSALTEGIGSGLFVTAISLAAALLCLIFTSLLRSSEK